MVLYSDLKDFKVYTTLGQEKGKISGLVVDLSNWQIRNVIVSPGLLKRKVFVRLEDVKEADEYEKKITIPGDVQEGDIIKSSSLSAAIVDETLLNKDVVSKDGEKVGELYDLDVPLKLRRWKIWKVLIKRGMKQRRLRYGPEEIDSVAEKIILKRTYKAI
ncbi:MAG: PRC-barrel domain-containing protein [Thermoplasmata archaeon]|nr:MAG: PRC-barrel domain-containing protein [Thermoplasmata archaeon]